MAFASTESPKTSPHLLKLLFVVIIVGCFSYLLLINWKNKFESSLLIGKKPTSSIIKTLYDVKCLSLLAKQFSICAFLIAQLSHWQL